LDDKDLCLNCVNTIISKDHIYKPIINDFPLTKMEQDFYRPDNRILTRMEQNIYIPDRNRNIEPLTLMIQDIYKNRTFMMQDDFINSRMYDDIKNIRNRKLIKDDEIIIDSLCMESLPCNHKVKVNGVSMTMDGSQIARKYWHLLNDTEKNHFSMYKKY